MNNSRSLGRSGGTAERAKQEPCLIKKINEELPEINVCYQCKFIEKVFFPWNWQNWSNLCWFSLVNLTILLEKHFCYKRNTKWQSHRDGQNSQFWHFSCFFAVRLNIDDLAKTQFFFHLFLKKSCFFRKRFCLKEKNKKTWKKCQKNWVLENNRLLGYFMIPWLFFFHMERNKRTPKKYAEKCC